ncbi:MAG: glycosyltransferase family 4 protein [Planctomycetes bacterium]|nr:glycosyltransferase family 4 protein [Planctomycetota bacterium]
MKILHLFSNWKWTGPAEPAVNLACRLADRNEVRFIAGSSPTKDLPGEVAAQAAGRGLDLVTGFRLNKHLNLRHNLLDAIRLRALLKDDSFDVIHTHMPNDHLITGLSCLGLFRKPVVIRSFYGAEGPEPKNRSGWLLKRFTSGAVVISQTARANLLNRYPFFPEARCASVAVGVDTKRFDASRFDRTKARISLGFDPRDFVFGIVARMQRHRRFETLLEAMRRVMAQVPEIKLMVVGRGTHREEVALGPVRAMGLSNRIIFPGYLKDEAFVQALAAMDAAIFLVPGSDGSCRAVREKMAMGLPMIASKVPPLDEMIEEGKTGYLVELTVDGLRDAILKMATDRQKTARMAEAAAAFGQNVFSVDRQARIVERFYAHCMQVDSGSPLEPFDPSK